jgi:hypothetical protein
MESSGDFEEAGYVNHFTPVPPAAVFMVFLLEHGNTVRSIPPSQMFPCMMNIFLAPDLGSAVGRSLVHSNRWLSGSASENLHVILGRGSIVPGRLDVISHAR